MSEENKGQVVPPENTGGHDTQKVIDWEQRRYEIAKDIMAAYNTVIEFNRYGIVEKAKMAVEEADALIRALKK